MLYLRNFQKALSTLNALICTHMHEQKKFPIGSHVFICFLPQKVKKVEPVKGAIIESMQHHGQGVYSGTFSGKCTLFTGRTKHVNLTNFCRGL